MKAIVLAAGLGTRLRPLTVRRPKPLVPVMNRPLLARILDFLASFGIREACLNLHHLPGCIEKFLSTRRDFAFYTAFEPDILDTGGGIAHFREVMEGEECFLLHNGDVLGFFNIDDFLAFHRKEGAEATLMLVDSAETNSVYASPWGVVVRLRDFIAAGWERALEGLAPLTYSGAALFSPSLFERLPRQGKCSLITVLIELMRERPGSVRAWVPQEVWWSDLGNAASYLAVHEACFGPSPPPLKEFDAVPLGCSAAPLQSTDASSRNLGRPRGSILLGKGSVVEEGASVEGFLVAGENCIVGKGTRLRNCVLWDGTAVRGLAAENSIIDGDVVVRA